MSFTEGGRGVVCRIGNWLIILHLALYSVIIGGLFCLAAMVISTGPLAIGYIVVLTPFVLLMTPLNCIGATWALLLGVKERAFKKAVLLLLVASPTPIGYLLFDEPSMQSYLDDQQGEIDFVGESGVSKSGEWEH